MRAPSAPSRIALPPLHRASTPKDVERMLAAGADPGARDSSGLTAVGFWLDRSSGVGSSGSGHGLPGLQSMLLAKMIRLMPLENDLPELTQDILLSLSRSRRPSMAVFDELWRKTGRDANLSGYVDGQPTSLLRHACAQALRNYHWARSDASSSAAILVRMIERRPDLGRTDAAGVTDECWLFLASLCLSTADATSERFSESGLGPFYWRDQGETLPCFVQRMLCQCQILAAGDNVPNVQPRYLACLARQICKAVPAGAARRKHIDQAVAALGLLVLASDRPHCETSGVAGPIIANMAGLDEQACSGVLPSSIRPSPAFIQGLLWWSSGYDLMYQASLRYRCKIDEHVTAFFHSVRRLPRADFKKLLQPLKKLGQSQSRHAPMAAATVLARRLAAGASVVPAAKGAARHRAM